LTGKGGTLILPGIYKGKKVPLNLDYAVLNEIRMFGVFSHDFRAVRPAIELVRQGRYPFGDMITHRFPLAEAERAVRLVAGEEEGEAPIKVLLDPKRA
jgi:alcohol dehydrogenase